MKEIKLRPNTDTFDLTRKTQAIAAFLEEGERVRVVVRFRGREITHPEVGDRQLKAIVAGITGVGQIEQPARLLGKQLQMTLRPAKPTR